MKSSVTLQELSLVQTQGGTVGATVEYPGFSNRRNAERAAQRDLRALATPLLSCTVYCGQEAADLDIGDTFKLEWPDYHEGAIIMRVTGMAFGDGRTDRIRIDCVEDVFGQPEAAILSDDRGSLWTNPTAPPDNIEEIDGNSSDQLVAATTQIAEELPYRLLVNEVGPRQIDAYMAETPDVGILATSGKRPLSGLQDGVYYGNAINAFIHVDAGSGYEQNGAAGFSPFARLVNDIEFLTTDLLVNEAQDLSAVEIGSFAQIDDELVRVDAIETTSEGVVVTVGRGILDTVPTRHLAGASILFWQNTAGSNGVEYEAGESINVKLQPRNNSGTAPLSSATPMPLTFDSRAIRPYPPGNVRINGTPYSGTFLEDGGELIIPAHPMFFDGPRFLSVACLEYTCTLSSWYTSTEFPLVQLSKKRATSFDTPLFTSLRGFSATVSGVTLARRVKYTLINENSNVSVGSTFWPNVKYGIENFQSFLEQDPSYYQLWRSTTGENFELTTAHLFTDSDGVPLEGQFVKWIGNVDERFVAVISTGGYFSGENYFRTSLDGLTWDDPILIDLPDLEVGREQDLGSFGNPPFIFPNSTRWLQYIGVLVNENSIFRFKDKYILSTYHKQLYHADVNSSDDLDNWSLANFDRGDFLYKGINAFVTTDNCVVAFHAKGWYEGGEGTPIINRTAKTIVRSTDGKNWTEVYSTSGSENAIEQGFYINGRIVFLGGREIYYSDDDGITWSFATQANGGQQQLSVIEQDGNILWGLTHKFIEFNEPGHRRPVLMYSEDAGLTWSLPLWEGSPTLNLTWSHRDRLQQTGGTFEDTTFQNIGPEEGTTYTARLEDSGGNIISEEAGIGTTSWLAVLDSSLDVGPFLIKLWSVRDGYASWQQHVIPVLRESPASSSGA